MANSEVVNGEVVNSGMCNILKIAHYFTTSSFAAPLKKYSMFLNQYRVLFV
jgi:hypothetical protein